MKTIDLYKAYQQKIRKFGVNDSERFRSSFVEAVNMVYAELNDQVFENNSLTYIDYFGDVIDSRLVSFTSMTFGSECNNAISDRDFWSIEWDFEKTSEINSFADSISFTSGDSFSLSISNGSIVVNDNGSDKIFGELPDICSDFKVKFVSDCNGNKILVNGEPIGLTYNSPSEGEGELNFPITVVDTHTISSISGLELKSTRFNTAGTVVYEFLFEEEVVATNLTDEVSGYTATLLSPKWDERWISPSSGLDDKYRSVMDMGLDYHLQDGGEWAIEPESERERKWYSRGIGMANNIYRNSQSYKSPLGI